jgi:hypothetical protein
MVSMMEILSLLEKSKECHKSTINNSKLKLKVLIASLLEILEAFLPTKEEELLTKLKYLLKLKAMILKKVFVILTHQNLKKCQLLTGINLVSLNNYMLYLIVSTFSMKSTIVFHED